MDAWSFCLTDGMVENMRSRFRAGEDTNEIADDYGCPVALVHYLVDDIAAID